MIHALTHIGNSSLEVDSNFVTENVAIDLSWDIIARFANPNLPREFYDDFVKVAEDEARVCSER